MRPLYDNRADDLIREEWLLSLEPDQRPDIVLMTETKL